MSIKSLTLVLLFVSATAQASYFVDTPPISIDLKMEGCFADKECAAQADKLIPLFAKKHNGMPAAEVREILQNCISPDSNMAFCIRYTTFAIADELKEIVQARLQKNPRDKIALPLRDMAQWSQKLEKECFRKVEKELPDASGFYFSEMIELCENKKVVAAMKKLR